MQDHPNPGALAGGPSRGNLEHRVQGWVLLELVTVPPPEGDDISKMAFGLKELRPNVEAAVDALVAAGLAARVGDTVRPSVRPTAAALRLDALWPVRT